VAEPEVTVGVAPSAPTVPEIPAAAAPVDWEKFMGVKLFAWLGGFALFLAVAYFVKYSFDHNLIPPAVRMALGFLVSLGLLVAGVLMRRAEYAVTSQTLCATGVVALYAVTFACRALYHFAFFGPIATFLLMSLITLTAFLLALRLNAMVVAILGMLGGFLTPLLLSTGEDNPVGLFGYIALLDAGLLAVALARRWHFLAALAAGGTLLMEVGWSARFFQVSKVFTALTVFVGFDALFLLGALWAQRRRELTRWLAWPAAGLAFATMIYAMSRLGYADLGARPVVLSLFVLGADLCLLALVLVEARAAVLQLAGGSLAFLFLGAWTVNYATNALLLHALGLYFVFAVLHAAFPIVLQRLRPGAAPVWWSQLSPAAALVLVLIPLLKFEVGWLVFWPVVLLLDVVGMVIALASASVMGLAVVMVLTGFIAMTWISRLPSAATDLGPALVVVAMFALIFVGAALWLTPKILARTGFENGGEDGARGVRIPGVMGVISERDVLAHMPALAAVLPFVLLLLMVSHLDLPQPSAVFAFGLLLVVLLLGLARAFDMQSLTAISLGCMLALEYVWHGRHFARAPSPAVVLGWYALLAGVFWAHPFVLRPKREQGMRVWAIAALSGPLHFFLVYAVVQRAYPNDYMGIVPLAFALPAAACLIQVVKHWPGGAELRNTALAWFGGALLFFITLIFPVQFDRQWLTLAWALEGAALCWLFLRVPHPGLRIVGLGLLAIAFARLALNPMVLGYHARSAVPIWNWYFYTYGLGASALYAAARFLAPPRHRVSQLNVPPILNAMGTILVFLLVNIEIADFFTPAGSRVLTFQFSGHFGRDMTYSIAWALFAFALVAVGIGKEIAAARYAGLGLLSVTLLKLFFHDLAQLNQLYRIGALAAVAVIAILASFLYQRFFASRARSAAQPQSAPNPRPDNR
jgi:uncharacterized membrane protein